MKNKKKDFKFLTTDKSKLKNAIIHPLKIKPFLKACDKANKAPIEPELMKILEALSKN